MGIIDNAIQNPQPAGQPPPEDDSADPQDIFRRLVLAAMKVIYTKEVTAQLVSMMEAGKDDPPTAVAKAANVVLGSIKQKIKDFEPDYVFSVAPTLITLLLEMGETAGLFETDLSMVKTAVNALAQLVQGEEAGPGMQPGMQPEMPPGMQPGMQPGMPAAMQQGA